VNIKEYHWLVHQPITPSLLYGLSLYRVNGTIGLLTAPLPVSQSYAVLVIIRCIKVAATPKVQATLDKSVFRWWKSWRTRTFLCCLL